MTNTFFKSKDALVLRHVTINTSIPSIVEAPSRSALCWLRSPKCIYRVCCLPAPTHNFLANWGSCSCCVSERNRDWQRKQKKTEKMMVMGVGVGVKGDEFGVILTRLARYVWKLTVTKEMASLVPVRNVPPWSLSLAIMDKCYWPK